MKRGPVIAVSGPPGSGKTTYARRLASDLGFNYHSAGSIFREIARRRGLTLEELSRIAEKDPSIDLEIDRRTLEIARQGNVVIEGHLVAWVLAHVADVLVYVKAPLEVRVMRVASRDGVDVSVAVEDVLVREESQALRFSRYYGFDVRDLSIFDLVVDTSTLSVDEVYQLILSYTCRKLLRLGYKVEACTRFKQCL